MEFCAWAQILIWLRVANELLFQNEDNSKANQLLCHDCLLCKHKKMVCLGLATSKILGCLQNTSCVLLKYAKNTVYYSPPSVCYRCFTNTLESFSKYHTTAHHQCLCYKTLTNTLDRSRSIILLPTTCVYICYKVFTNTLDHSQRIVLLPTTCVYVTEHSQTYYILLKILY